MHKARLRALCYRRVDIRGMKKLAIIDTFALLHRAWHAIPPNLTTKDGQMVNAVYGFTMILLRLLKELKPDYVVAAFDLPHETFRKKEYKEYKAQREAPEKDFIDQIALTEEVLKAFEIPMLATPGYEADDIIGSLSHKFSQDKTFEVTIVSGDLDTLQLVNKRTKVYTMRKGIQDTVYYDEAAVMERYGIRPDQVIDLKALAGDASDNIPGVRGIGPKGASTLIQEFGSLENLYQHLDSKKIKPRIQELLKTYKDDAFMSKKLATIVTNLPIKFDLEKAAIGHYNPEKVTDVFQKFEFRSLLKSLPASTHSVRAVPTKKAEHIYDVVETEDGMKKLAEKLAEQKQIGFDTETEGLDPLCDKMLGASFAWSDGGAAFVHARTDSQRATFVKNFKHVLSSEHVKKIGHNIKFDYEMLQQAGITMGGMDFDTLIGAYLIHPNRSLKLEDLVFSYLRVKMQTLSELAEAAGAKGKGKRDIDVAKIPAEELAQYGAADADMALQLYRNLEPELKKEKLEKLLHTIEMPLIPILAAMETKGILIDIEYLKKKEKEFTAEIKKIEQKIFKAAGTEFNVASPLQLKEVLFEKLKIETKGIKRKKTGLSTAADELEKMYDAHPIIPLIMEYRELSKLVNTYLATLPDMINPTDKRLHTNFNQTIAATGRLSSVDPNLQNIPVRTALGKAIRRGFVAPKGMRLVSADYSQIELRLAAVISKDPKMLASFKAGEDIHRRTAAEVNHVSLDEVTPDQRRHAKEVNFGVIYGLGSTGLAQRTGMSRLEAKEFIARYFELYEGVRRYVDETKSFAHEHGFVETLFGRKRKLPEIYSSSPMLVAQAERMAVNMPLQGTAADLMKLAMITVASELPKHHPDCIMLLQVHDELVFEVPEKEAPAAARVIKKIMEGVASYPIPLAVDVKEGKNWADMEPINI